ncbi:hypothetical protein QQF64_028577 [Cirrhinus molitorella]|uniref:Uncharacterized protein n=1 Tax=Cirrhinus molitorella TaxID=172907 RepID=A0ABR3N717_9TELE
MNCRRTPGALSRIRAQSRQEQRLPPPLARHVSRGLQQLETLTPVNVHIRGLPTHSTHTPSTVSTSRLCPKPGRAPLATRSNAKQPMEGRRPRAILPSGRVSLTLIGRKLLWERKFGKFHTSRSRAVGDINKTNTTLRQAVATSAGKR